MSGVRRALVATFSVAAFGCGTPQFRVPTAPSLRRPQIEAPRPPEPRPIKSKVDLGELQVDAAAAEAATTPSEGRIAILPVRRPNADAQSVAVTRGALRLLGAVIGDPDERGADAAKKDAVIPADAADVLQCLIQAGVARLNASGDPVARHLEDRLMRELMKSGVTRFLGPDELGAIAARKVARRDGEVTWRGSLDELVRVEPVTGADLLVAVRLDVAQAAEIPSVTRYEYPAEAFATYRAEHGKFASAQQQFAEEARVAAEAYEAQCRTGQQRYENEGGKYGAQAGETTSGDRGKAECERTLGRLGSVEGEASTLRASVPTPDELLKQAAERKEETPVPVFDLAAQVRLIDAKELRLLWIGDLSVRGESAEDAVGKVVAHIVAEVSRLRQAGAAARAALPAWRRR